MTPMINVKGLAKSFTLHLQGGLNLPVFADLDLRVETGECVALHGPSGAGKSTLLRALYANYKADCGNVFIVHENEIVDMAQAPARTILAVRRKTIGYVSQFLQAVPRVPALDVVAEPLLALGCGREDARARARPLLARLNIPERLWSVPPITFSGGEQQRVNVARGFVADYPILLLDEPTASLDQANRRVVIDLILEAKARGAAIVGIFHDQEARAAVADRLYEITPAANAA